MSSQQDKGQPLPKFGEWDVNNPASAEGFTLLFNKARDEKMKNPAATRAHHQRTDSSTYAAAPKSNDNTTSSCKKKWFCCGYIRIVRTAK